MKTIKLMYLVLFVALFVGACKKDETAPTNTNPTPPPTGSSAVANFTFTPATGAAPLQVQFTNTSTNATTYLWEFGNGQTSTVANASTTYATAGTYNIKLTATAADGKRAERTASIVVTAPVVTQPLKANLTYSFDGVRRGTNYLVRAKQPMQFFDRSTGGEIVSWRWSSEPFVFSSTEQNPKFTFDKSGVYKITLQVTDKAGRTAQISGNFPIYGTLVDGAMMEHVAYGSQDTVQWIAHPDNILRQFNSINTAQGAALASLRIWGYDGVDSNTTMNTYAIHLNPHVQQNGNWVRVPIQVGTYEIDRNYSWEFGIAFSRGNFYALLTHDYASSGTITVTEASLRRVKGTYNVLYDAYRIIGKFDIQN